MRARSDTDIRVHFKGVAVAGERDRLAVDALEDEQEVAEQGSLWWRSRADCWGTAAGPRRS